MKTVFVLFLDDFQLRIPAQYMGSGITRDEMHEARSAAGEKLAAALGATYSHSEMDDDE